jgi:hypothetical protein
MADIVQSLFGLTPEAYRQQQMNEADRMALGYAQLTPQQRASFGMARAGYQLGGVLGSALGAQDPALQLISNRQAIARQIDPTDPETMRAGILALNQAGDTVGAMQLTQLLQERLRSTADIGRLEAAAQASLAASGRQRTEATPADILKAREVASLEQQKAQLVAEGGSPAQIAAIDAQLSVLRPQRAAEAAPESVRVAQSIAKLLEERDTLSAAPDQTPQTARKIQIIDAQLAQLQKQEKPESIPAQISLANAIADAQEQVFALQSQPASATRDEQLRRASARLNALERQLPKEPATPRGPSVGAEREAEALAQYGKTFTELTQEQQRIVNQRVSAEQSSRATANAPKIILPGQPVGPQDWMKFENFISGDPTLKRTNELLSVMPSAIDTISRITTNDVAARALPATLARLVGETGPLSNRDVARFARTGGLDDRLAQAATEFITGRGTQQQKDQAVRYLSAVYRGALLEKRKLYVDQAERLGYNQSPEYRVTLAQLDRELAKFREVRPQQPAAPVAQPAQAPRATTGNPLVDKYLNQ